MTKLIWKIILCLLPVMAIIALVVHARNIESFDFMIWLSRLQELDLSNPIAEYRQAIMDFARLQGLAQDIGTSSNFIEAIQGIWNLLRNFFELVWGLALAGSRGIFTALKDVLMFFNWLTLGTY